MGFAVPAVREETNQTAQGAVADFLKMAEKRVAKVNKK